MPDVCTIDIDALEAQFANNGALTDDETVQLFRIARAVKEWGEARHDVAVALDAGDDDCPEQRAAMRRAYVALTKLAGELAVNP